MRSVLACGLIATLFIGSPPLGAQAVTLQIRPRAGDTLRMRLDQQSEMTGVKRTSNSQATAMVIATMHMYSRAIVEASSEKSTTVLAVTDSVQLSTTDERARLGLLQAQAQMRGQRVRFHVAPEAIELH